MSAWREGWEPAQPGEDRLYYKVRMTGERFWVSIDKSERAALANGDVVYARVQNNCSDWPFKVGDFIPINLSSTEFGLDPNADELPTLQRQITAAYFTQPFDTN